MAAAKITKKRCTVQVSTIVNRKCNKWCQK